MHDLIVRGGTVVDGTGEPAVAADVAVDGGRITQIGRVDGDAAEVIDATGKLVTPGFVDVHTHYDGQVTWDPLLTPASGHGVTTIVMGNCGVGFAPARPDKHDWIIGLMEGVEDIPGAALSAGIRWGWETFPEFLDFLDEQPLALDVGTQVPHGAVGASVMGERGSRNEPATSDDAAGMAAIVREGIEAGALGVSTSRTIAHRAIDGEPVPGTFAAEDELFAMGRALADAGAGVFELAPAGVLGEDLAAADREMDWMLRLAAEMDRPVTFAMIQHDQDPDQWKRMLDLALEVHERGVPIRPQVAYSRFTHDPIREMVANPMTALGLGDGGAHCGAICDASIETYMLTHWVRDRSRGERLPLELVIRKMTSDTASLYGLGDRGEITPGKKADLNVVDLDALTLRRPEMHYDLPGGARRLLQRTEGYDATIVSGEVVLRNGEDTGARPGALLRGAR